MAVRTDSPSAVLTVRKGKGRKRMWRPTSDLAIEMPLIIDIAHRDGATDEDIWSVEAQVDLVGRQPEVVSVTVKGMDGLDVDLLQREFRWGYPLHLVTTVLPDLMSRGIDPFGIDLSQIQSDLSQGAMAGHAVLTDEFLESIASDYLEYGRGYASRIAAERGTTKRTVVSWIEKARERGILSPALGRGRVGGEIIPVGQRTPVAPAVDVTTANVPQQRTQSNMHQGV